MLVRLELPHLRVFMTSLAVVSAVKPSLRDANMSCM